MRSGSGENIGTTSNDVVNAVVTGGTRKGNAALGADVDEVNGDRFGKFSSFWSPKKNSEEH